MHANTYDLVYYTLVERWYTIVAYLNWWIIIVVIDQLMVITDAKHLSLLEDQMLTPGSHIFPPSLF